MARRSKMLADPSEKIPFRPASPDEAGLFYAQTPEQDLEQGCIGHVRMDFGRGGSKFWHTWHCRGPEEWNSPEFKEELTQVVDTLRESVLRDLPSMQRFCHEHGGAIKGGWVQNYGYVVETDRYRYCLRCNPNPGDYQAYLTCFDKQVQVMRQNGSLEPREQEAYPGGWHNGDICYLITNKAKRQAVGHTVESFDGTYFGVRSRTGLFHRASPSRLFHSKEEAIHFLESSQFPTAQTKKILEAFPLLAQCAERASAENRKAAAEKIMAVLGQGEEQGAHLTKLESAMTYCDCGSLWEAVAVAEHLDCFECVSIADFKQKTKDELTDRGVSEKVVDQSLDFAQYAAGELGWDDLFAVQSTGQYVHQSDMSFLLSDYAEQHQAMKMEGL